MDQKPLPLLFVLPESGSRWPEEFPAERQAGLQRWLRPEAVALARVFALEHRTPHVLIPEPPPLLLDLDAPVRRAVRSRTPDRRPLYTFGFRSGRACRLQVQQAYRSFHGRVAAILAQGKVRAGLDCRMRPLAADLSLCVGNNGDVTGEPRPGGGSLTCPADLARDLRDMLAARFSDLPGKIGLNRSGRDSALGRQYRRFQTPWLTLDLAPQLLAGGEGKAGRERELRLQERLDAALLLWCKLEGWMGESAA